MHLRRGNKYPFGYINEIVHQLPEYVEFKPGINIIVGPNGSGKSTLLKLIQAYTLCEGKLYSEYDEHAFHRLFDSTSLSDMILESMKSDQKVIFKDDCLIQADYDKSVFNLRTTDQMSQSDSMSSSINFAQTYESMHSSDGEKCLIALNVLFKAMFKENHTESPRSLIKSKINKVNDLWSEKFKKLSKYYDHYHRGSDQYTILMDEPDKNLDIDNLQQIYTILSVPRNDTQIIAILHNPLLIYKLSRMKHVNFVETKLGYLKSVIDFASK